MARFRGVRRDLEREIAGDMCTVEQARRYLEHLEIVLLLEQDGDTPSTPSKAAVGGGLYS